MSTPLPERREWTEDDSKRFKEFVNREGYDAFKLRMQKLALDFTQDLLNTRNLENIAKVETINTILKICDNERT